MIFTILNYSLLIILSFSFFILIQLAIYTFKNKNNEANQITVLKETIFLVFSWVFSTSISFLLICYIILKTTLSGTAEEENIIKETMTLSISFFGAVSTFLSFIALVYTFFHQKKKEHLLAQPLFELSHEYSGIRKNIYNGYFNCEFSIKNFGSNVTNIKFNLKSDLYPLIRPHSITSLRKDESQKLVFMFSEKLNPIEPLYFDLDISYSDSNKEEQLLNYNFIILPPHGNQYYTSITQKF